MEAFRTGLREQPRPDACCCIVAVDGRPGPCRPRRGGRPARP
ncbi:hypothetical protein AB5I41_03360 [Sphingomonas sp. MMS24-JH45]